jgi:thioredoxin 1
MAHLESINDSNFEKVIGEGLTIVDFWAPWCQPCLIQGPILERVAQRVNGKAKVCKLNVDENMATPGKFGITGIPTMIIFKDGQPAKQFVGVQGENTLVQAVESLN